MRFVSAASSLEPGGLCFCFVCGNPHTHTSHVHDTRHNAPPRLPLTGSHSSQEQLASNRPNLLVPLSSSLHQPAGRRKLPRPRECASTNIHTPFSFCPLAVSTAQGKRVSAGLHRPCFGPVEPLRRRGHVARVPPGSQPRGGRRGLRREQPRGRKRRRRRRRRRAEGMAVGAPCGRGGGVARGPQGVRARGGPVGTECSGRPAFPGGIWAAPPVVYAPCPLVRFLPPRDGMLFGTACRRRTETGE